MAEEAGNEEGDVKRISEDQIVAVLGLSSVAFTTVAAVSLFRSCQSGEVSLAITVVANAFTVSIITRILSRSRR